MNQKTQETLDTIERAFTEAFQGIAELSLGFSPSGVPDKADEIAGFMKRITMSAEEKEVMASIRTKLTDQEWRVLHASGRAVVV